MVNAQVNESSVHAIAIEFYGFRVFGALITMPQILSEIFIVILSGKIHILENFHF